MRYRLGLKWKIFSVLAALGVLAQAFNLWRSGRLVLQAISNTEIGVKGILVDYTAFQLAMSKSYSVGIDIWASSRPLQEALSKGTEAEERPLLYTLRDAIEQTLHPDITVVVNRYGKPLFGPNSPINEGDVRQMRVFTDLRSGQTVRNQVVEHNGEAYVVNGRPIESGGQVVGGVLLGLHIERLLREFKTHDEETTQRRVELALVHNNRITASTVRPELVNLLSEAIQRENQEIIEEGGERVPVINFGNERYEFQRVVINGYDGALTAVVGSLYVLRSRAHKEQRIQALVLGNYVVMAGSVIIALLAAALLTWFVMRPIREFIDATREITRGQGDLTRRLPVTTRDELGQLAQNLNELFDNLYRLARDVSGASEHVGTSSEEISAASRRMLTGSKDQAVRIESSTAAVTELSASIQQVAENALQATKVAKESGAKVQEALDGINRIRQTVVGAAERIHELGESGKRIGNIVEVIRQISEQTSLLALNASIEAAHAGEQGRGFAVVADEVSSLAKRVGQSARDIEDLIGTIRDQTDEAVRSMQVGTQEVEGGSQVVTQTLSSLRKIVDMVQKTAAAVQEQAVVSDEIARNMDAVRTVTHAVLTSSEEVVRQGDELHALAGQLEESVSNFNVRHRHKPPPDGGGAGKPEGPRDRERRERARSAADRPPKRLLRE